MGEIKTAGKKGGFFGTVGHVLSNIGGTFAKLYGEPDRDDGN